MLHIALMLLGIGSAPKVDWREPGCRLSVFAEACEERLGFKVVASPEVADQVVMFAVRETSPEVLLKRVAEAVGGELELDDEGIYRFFRSPRLAEQQRRDHEAMVAAEFSQLRERLVRGAALDREVDKEFLGAWRADRARFDEVERDARYFLEREHQMRDSAHRFGARLLRGSLFKTLAPSEQSGSACFAPPRRPSSSNSASRRFASWHGSAQNERSSWRTSRSRNAAKHPKSPLPASVPRARAS